MAWIGLAMPLWMFVSGCGFPKKNMSLQELLPEQVGEWRRAGTDQEFDSNTLYDYIDGAAEVYLRYSFQRLQVREYTHSTHPEQPSITAEVFDMGSPQGAYGMFTFSREGPGVGVGTESEYVPCVLRFWKDRYLVAIYADHETPAVKEAILALGRRIAAAIREEAPPPDLIRMLPVAGLVSTNLRYFRDPFCLSYHFPIGGENVFRLTPETEAVLATYQLEEGRTRLLLVRYPDSEKAGAAWEEVARHFQLPAGTAFPALERQTWVGGRQVGPYVMAVFQAASEHAARRLLDEVSQNLR